MCGFGWEGLVEALLCWDVVVKRVFRGVVDGSWGDKTKTRTCRHHDGKWLYKLKLRALQMVAPAWDGKDGSTVLAGMSLEVTDGHHRRAGGEETRRAGYRFACPEFGLGHLQVAACAISTRITKSVMPVRPVLDSRAWRGWVAVKSPWRRCDGREGWECANSGFTSPQGG